jgi:hypothetical protein
MQISMSALFISCMAEWTGERSAKPSYFGSNPNAATNTFL